MSDKQYAVFKGGPPQLNGTKHPFVGRAEPVKILDVRLFAKHLAVRHRYKRTTRKGDTHYYKFLYTATRYV